MVMLYGVNTKRSTRIWKKTMMGARRYDMMGRGDMMDR